MNIDVLLDLQNLAFVAIAFIYSWVLKLVFDFGIERGFDSSQALVDQRNLAVGLRRAGLYLAVPIGMLGAISGPSFDPFWTDVQTIVIDGALLLGFLPPCLHTAVPERRATTAGGARRRAGNAEA